MAGKTVPSPMIEVGQHCCRQRHPVPNVGLTTITPESLIAVATPDSSGSHESSSCITPLDTESYGKRIVDLQIPHHLPLRVESAPRREVGPVIDPRPSRAPFV